jgi:hypothetical protein
LNGILGTRERPPVRPRTKISPVKYETRKKSLGDRGERGGRREGEGVGVKGRKDWGGSECRKIYVLTIGMAKNGVKINTIENIFSNSWDNSGFPGNNQIR